MQSSVVSATPWGIEARPVRIEVDVPGAEIRTRRGYYP